MPLDFVKLTVKFHTYATATKEEATISNSLRDMAYNAACKRDLGVQSPINLQ